MACKLLYTKVMNKKNCNDPLQTIINKLIKNKLIKKSLWYDFVFYTYKLVGNEEFVENEVRSIYYQLLCNNATVVNVINGTVFIKNNVAKEFILIEKFDIVNDRLKISFLDLNNMIVYKEIKMKEYFAVNKRIYNDNMIAFNSLKNFK